MTYRNTKYSFYAFALGIWGWNGGVLCAGRHKFNSLFHILYLDMLDYFHFNMIHTSVKYNRKNSSMFMFIKTTVKENKWHFAHHSGRMKTKTSHLHFEGTF